MAARIIALPGARTPTMAERRRWSRRPRSGCPFSFLDDQWPGPTDWPPGQASSRQQTIVRRTRMAERRARQPRNDLAPAYREQVSHQRQPPLSRLFVARVPIEDGGSKRQGIQRVGNPIAVLRIGAGKLLAPAVAYGIRKLALEIAEERERCFRAPFFAHEQHRDGRRQ